MIGHVRKAQVVAITQHLLERFMGRKGTAGSEKTDVSHRYLSMQGLKQSNVSSTFDLENLQTDMFPTGKNKTKRIRLLIQPSGTALPVIQTPQ